MSTLKKSSSRKNKTRKSRKRVVEHSSIILHYKAPNKARIGIYMFKVDQLIYFLDPKYGKFQQGKISVAGKERNSGITGAPQLYIKTFKREIPGSMKYRFIDIDQIWNLEAFEITPYYNAINHLGNPTCVLNIEGGLYDFDIDSPVEYYWPDCEKRDWKKCTRLIKLRGKFKRFNKRHGTVILEMPDKIVSVPIEYINVDKLHVYYKGDYHTPTPALSEEDEYSISNFDPLSPLSPRYDSDFDPLSPRSFIYDSDFDPLSPLSPRYDSDFDPLSPRSPRYDSDFETYSPRSPRHGGKSKGMGWLERIRKTLRKRK